MYLSKLASLCGISDEFRISQTIKTFRNSADLDLLRGISDLNSESLKQSKLSETL